MFKIFTMTMKRNFKNIPMMASIVLLTLLLIFILGNALESMQTSGVVVKEKVLYYNPLETILQTELNEWLLSEDLEQVFEISIVESVQKGEELMEAGNYQSFIAVSNENANEVISFYTVNPETPLISMLKAFQDTSNYMMHIYSIGGQFYGEQPSILERVVSHKGIPVGIDYYAVQTMLQMLIFGGLFGIFSVLEDYDQNLFIRLSVSPIKRGQVMAARAIANTLFLSFLSFCIIIGSIILYGANWGERPGLIILAVILQSAMITGVGMVLATMTKSASVATGLLVVLMIYWSKVAGAYNPAPDTGFSIYLSPNTHSKNIMFSAIYGGSNHLIIISILWLLMTCVIVYGGLVIVDWRLNHVRA